jgi:RNA polymerase sigma-70 factor (ECF subfamily)
MDPDLRAQTAAALAGDPDAFEALIRRHGRTLYAVAYSLLHDSSEAEDVVQETFLKAWQTRHRPADPGKFPAWLATLARNRARDILRRRGGQPLPAEEELPADPAAPPGTELDTAFSATALRAALAKLPDHHREALTLRYLDGLECRAVEHLMGLSNGALRGILGRALGTLRRTLPPSVRPTP